MPYVHVRIAKPLDLKQKGQIVEEISDSLEKITGTPKSKTQVVIEEVSRENWGSGGRLLSER